LHLIFFWEGIIMVNNALDAGQTGCGISHIVILVKSSGVILTMQNGLICSICGALGSPFLALIFPKSALASLWSNYP
jgi:hypothetical protein